jgi:PPM family protein phosphatase
MRTACSGFHAALTDRGRLREVNEDAYCVQPQLGLYLVTDGVGGEGNGAAAAAIVAQQFQGCFESTPPLCGSPFVADTKRRIASAVQELHRRTRTVDGTGKTRATIVAAILNGNSGLVAHLGDSPAYLFREGELTRLTKDHTFGQLLVDTGDMDPNDLETSPYRSQIIGMAENPAPDFREFEWGPRDVLLLCSDGLTSMLPDENIRQVLKSVADVTEAAKRLVACANDAGGLDNVTVVLVRKEV